MVPILARPPTTPHELIADEAARLAEERYQSMMKLNSGNDPRALDLALGLLNAPGLIDDHFGIDKWVTPPYFKWRNDAVLTLQKWGDASLAPRILPFLKDANPNARIIAIRALAMLDAQGEKHSIAEMLAPAQPPGVRAEAVAALVQMRAVEYVPLIGALLDEDIALPRFGDEWTPDTPSWFYPFLSYYGNKPATRFYANIIDASAIFEARNFSPGIERLAGKNLETVTGSAVRTLLKFGTIPETQAKRILAKFVREKHFLWDEDQEEMTVLFSMDAIEHVDLLLTNFDRRGDSAFKLMSRSDLVALPSLIAGFLDSDLPEIRQGAIDALTRLRAVECAPAVAFLLSPGNTKEDRDAAFYFLWEFPNPDAQSGTAVLLNDVDPAWRRRAVDLLARERARDLADAVTLLLKDNEPKVRLATVSALGAIGTKQHAGQIAELLNEADSVLRETAIVALRQMEAREQAGKILPLLGDPSLAVVLAVADAVKKLYPAVPDEALPLLLGSMLTHPGRGEPLFERVQGLFDRQKRFERVLSFFNPDPDASGLTLPDTVDEARQTVESLRELWLLAGRHRVDRVLLFAGDAAERIIASQDWKPEDAPWLRDLAAGMASLPGLDRHAAFVSEAAERAYENDPARRLMWATLRWTGLVSLVVFAVWTFVFALYPWSAISRWVIWSRWARRLTGAGLLVRLLRRSRAFHTWLWKPFRDSLLPPGEMQTFDEWTFFDSIRIAPAAPESGGPRLALRELREAQGVWVLQGVSGLGKTTLLQCLAATAGRPVAFLRAGDCREGILETLRLRLPTHAQGDPAFLRSLVQGGSLLLLLDALHEVPRPVLEHLVTELDTLTGARVILTTQPLVWTPPRGAVLREVLPLRPEDTATFLLKQGTAAIEAMGAGSLNAKVGAFTQKVREFLTDIASRPPDSHVHRMLANPMEAVLAAEVLAAGEMPDPARLLEQRLGQVDRDYATRHREPFPAMPFASWLCACRLRGTPSFEMTGFENVAALLARHRLLRKGDDGWRFRHDKIMDWFLLPAFSAALGGDELLAGDPRFASTRELMSAGH